MMGIQPSEAKALPYWEYTAYVSGWNKQQDPDNDSEPVEAPDEDFVEMRAARLVELGIARVLH